MMQIVPMLAVPSQQVKTVLNQQIVDLDIYQLRYGLFIDVYVNGVLEIGGVICENLNRIIRNGYLNAETGFSGDFAFNDTEGSTDPVFAGLGTRYQLLYLTAADLTSVGISE